MGYFGTIGPLKEAIVTKRVSSAILAYVFSTENWNCHFLNTASPRDVDFELEKYGSISDKRFENGLFRHNRSLNKTRKSGSGEFKIATFKKYIQFDIYFK